MRSGPDDEPHSVEHAIWRSERRNSDRGRVHGCGLTGI
jgi:hypothetical protein